MGNMFLRSEFASTIGSIFFFYTIFERYIPPQLRRNLQKYTHRLIGAVNPYIQIVFHESTGERLERSEVYAAIQNYLSSDSSRQAKRLKADLMRDSKKIVLSMDDYEEITDSYEGAQMSWVAAKTVKTENQPSYYSRGNGERRYYKLTFHKKHRELVVNSYLNHVLEEGKFIKVQNRQRKLYTNNRSDRMFWPRESMWSHVFLDHPASFRTLAMDPAKKKEIVDDLITFSKSKEYYREIGKAWKRGYLLYGPPGTGKSTMIAAMANLLEYDIYDLELTAVKDNTELRKLLIEVSSKSIIVIEDIDCSLDLTGQRKKKKRKRDEDDEEDEEEEKKDPEMKEAKKEMQNDKQSKVTLSGLLNFIDGLWSACGDERLLVFTTNHVDDLDPALIRRGRMDKHIELSYCTFEAFKVLAKNYLGLESHQLFETIELLLNETEMTPADVAESLTPKTAPRDVKACLRNLIEALENAKEAARLKAEEQEKKRLLKKEKKEKAAKEASTSSNEEAKREDQLTAPKEIEMNGNGKEANSTKPES
ncbi:hypothetical protein Scep_017607 [Stephania cephalantha]|uniref:AAA+ ATPase domain-containing protein n=1 Tax=Stephania cephalantha TaxID=152367 RepID=A0AAP0NV41_9MAGN